MSIELEKCAMGMFAEFLSLGDGEQRIVATLLLHEIIKAPLFRNRAVFQREQIFITSF